MNLIITVTQLISLCKNRTGNIPKGLKDVANYYDFLSHFKDHSDYYITNDLIDHDYISSFPADTLAELNIFLKGANNLLLDKRNFTALVWNCHLTADVLDDSVAGIKVFGNGYLEANLQGKSATAIKAYGKSTVEVSAKDHAMAMINLFQKSNGNIQNRDESMVMVLNNSHGEHVFQGNEQLILK